MFGQPRADEGLQNGSRGICRAIGHQRDFVPNIRTVLLTQTIQSVPEHLRTVVGRKHDREIPIVSAAHVYRVEPDSQ